MSLATEKYFEKNTLKLNKKINQLCLRTSLPLISLRLEVTLGDPNEQLLPET